MSACDFLQLCSALPGFHFHSNMSNVAFVSGESSSMTDNIRSALHEVWSDFSVLSIARRELTLLLLEDPHYRLRVSHAAEVLLHRLNILKLGLHLPSIHDVLADTIFVVEGENDDNISASIVRLNVSELRKCQSLKPILNCALHHFQNSFPCFDMLDPKLQQAIQMTWPDAADNEDDYLASTMAVLLGSRRQGKFSLPAYSLYLSDVGGFLRSVSHLHVFRKGSKRQRLSDFLSQPKMRMYFRLQDTSTRVNDRVVVLLVDRLLTKLESSVPYTDDIFVGYNSRESLKNDKENAASDIWPEFEEEPSLPEFLFDYEEATDEASTLDGDSSRNLSSSSRHFSLSIQNIGSSRYPASWRKSGITTAVAASAPVESQWPKRRSALHSFDRAPSMASSMSGSSAFGCSPSSKSFMPPPPISEPSHHPFGSSLPIKVRENSVTSVSPLNIPLKSSSSVVADAQVNISTSLFTSPVGIPSQSPIPPAVMSCWEGSKLVSGRPGSHQVSWGGSSPEVIWQFSQSYDQSYMDIAHRRLQRHASSDYSTRPLKPTREGEALLVPSVNKLRSHDIGHRHSDSGSGEPSMLGESGDSDEVSQPECGMDLECVLENVLSPRSPPMQLATAPASNQGQSSDVQPTRPEDRPSTANGYPKPHASISVPVPLKVSGSPMPKVAMASSAPSSSSDMPPRGMISNGGGYMQGNGSFKLSGVIPPPPPPPPPPTSGSTPASQRILTGYAAVAAKEPGKQVVPITAQRAPGSKLIPVADTSSLGIRPTGNILLRVPEGRLSRLSQRVREEIAALVGSNTSLKLEDFDDGVLHQLTLKMSEDEAVASLRAIAEHDVSNIQHMAAYINHVVKNYRGGTAADVAISLPSATVRANSMPLSSKAMLQKLPLKVFKKLEDVVSRTSYMEWKHFDAGVIKVMSQLAEINDADVLEELALLETTDLSNVEYMPAYLNKRLNNKLWSRRKMTLDRST